MRRFAVAPAVGLMCGVVLSMTACPGVPGPQRPGMGGTPGAGGAGGSVGTGGQPGFGGQPGTGGQGGSGGQAGAGTAGQGGSGGQAGGGGAVDAGSGTGGSGGTGGTPGPARDAGAADASSSAGEGGLAALDAFCTPKVVLRIVDTGTGGQRFMMALGGTTEGVTATVQQMGREICRYLYRSADEVRPANEIELTVEPNLPFPAGKSGNIGKVKVQFSGSYIANYTGDVAKEVKGILYHEMTHIYQNDDKPEGQGPGGWAGLAEYYESHGDAVRTHFGHTSCGAPNKSGTWDRGAYCARAHWWLFLENKYPGFLYQLNLQMKGGDGMVWTPARGATIVGKPFEELWNEYRAATCCAGSDRSCCM
jgi:hypothetical protein